MTDFLLYVEESFIRLSEPKDQERFSDQNLFIVCHHCLWNHRCKHSTNLGIKYFYVYSIRPAQMKVLTLFQGFNKIEGKQTNKSSAKHPKVKGFEDYSNSLIT